MQNKPEQTIINTNNLKVFENKEWYSYRPKINSGRFPTNNKDKGITLNTISSHTFGDIDVKPSRGDGQRSNLGQEMCDQLPGVTSCQL